MTALAAAGLVGCASTSVDDSCPRPSSSSTTSDLIDVSGAVDTAPDIEVRTPFHVAETTSYDLETGDGPQITTDSQLVVLDLSLVSGETGQPLVATSYNGDTSRPLSLTQWAQTFPQFGDALMCASEGSRVVVALSADGISPDAVAGLGLEDGESAVAVVDVRKVYLPKADGADQYNDARGLPTVVRAPDGRPGIIVPDADAPTEPVVQVLKKGDGAEVNDDDSVLFAFTSVDWDDPKTTVNTTWDSEPLRQTLDALPPVIADALRGQPAGSQLMVVQPAGDADAAQAQPAIVYVIDVLGVG
ncbi:hypothetical protein DEA06_04340 [Microbacterium sp. Gd 4-13]|nr:hypothetical protein DEA06_04340 [Microbacterium sp. Gd 4-13]